MADVGMRGLALTRAVDRRTLHFGPLGLGGEMPPEACAALLDAEMRELALPRDVPDGVQSQFEKLKGLYRDGLFTYASFTQAEREAYRVLEIALKVRFLEHYAGRIPVNIYGSAEDRAARSFDDVRGLLGDGKAVTLAGHPRFNGSLASLLRWARADRYLYGQGNRARELATLWLRNELTHTEHDVVSMPPDTLRTLHHVFEIVCRLWEHDPPRTRSYPDPMRRIAQVLGLGPKPGEATWFHLERMTSAHDDERKGRAWYVVLAVDGEHLPDWREGAERTRTPIRRLWGPGSWDELKAEVAKSANTWVGDETTTLDRMFFVRVLGGVVEIPRTAEQVRGLRERVMGERWLAIKADGPGDALGHIRRWMGMAPLLTDTPCRAQGWCGNCAVEIMVPLARRDTIDRFIRNVVPTIPGPRRV